MSDVLPTPVKRIRELGVLVIRRMIREKQDDRSKGWANDLNRLANWLSSFGDEPEEADAE